MQTRRPSPSTITLLDKGCEFDGKLSFEGVVRIDGIFRGEIFSQDHLIIGEGAMVEGDVQVGELEIGGSFKGNILAKDRVTIHASARVQAKVQANELEVQKGAVFDGTVEMSTLRNATRQPDDGIVAFGNKTSASA